MQQRDVLLVPATATVLPLVYGIVLARADPSWAAFEVKTMGTGTAPWWALLASFGPLGALAGARGPSASGRGPVDAPTVDSCLRGVVFLDSEFPLHALSGITLPLAVLAVRGWSRVGRPPRLSTPLGVAAILAFTVPGAVYHARASREDFTDPTHAAVLVLQVLSPGEAAALAFIARSPRPGGVLAPQFLSMSVPSLTGHPAYAGHFMWQPSANSYAASFFFDPALNDPTGAGRRGILRRSRAVYVIAECGAPPPLVDAIAPHARPVRRFGCVTVYETR